MSDKPETEVADPPTPEAAAGPEPDSPEPDPPEAAAGPEPDPPEAAAGPEPDPPEPDPPEPADVAEPTGDQPVQSGASTAIQSKPSADPLPQPRPQPERPDWWPGPARPAGPVLLATAATAGLLAAVLVPLGRPGLGWPLAGLAVLGATVAGLRRSGATHRREAMAWGLVAIALLATGTLRAAEWMFWLCVVAAIAATALAVTRGRTTRRLALGLLLLPAAMVRSPQWAHRSLAGLRGRIRPTVRLVPTLALTAVILLVFGALLVSADEAFAEVLGRVVPDLSAATLARWLFLFAMAAGLVLGAAFLLVAPPAMDRTSAGHRTVRLAEWAIPVGALVGLFVTFVAVQLTVLFGGADYVLGPDGPSYADHARGGFWQLLIVTALTLLVIGVAATVAPQDTPVEQLCLRVLLAALAALSLVIVASALFRMQTYQDAYGFTRLRVLVSVTELWLGLVFVMVFVASVRLRAGWVPRAVVATGIAALLALAVANPDRFIAERNLDRWADGKKLDVSYLAGLSTDAVPALVCLPEPERDAVLARMQRRLDAVPDDWRSANLSRTIARELIAEPTCARR